MGYMVFKGADDSGEAEAVVGESAAVALTDKQRKTIWSWCSYLGRALARAVLQRLAGQQEG